MCVCVCFLENFNLIRKWVTVALPAVQYPVSISSFVSFDVPPTVVESFLTFDKVDMFCNKLVNS